MSMDALVMDGLERARHGENALVCVLEKADPSWKQSFWNNKLVKDLRKINGGGLGQIKKYPMVFLMLTCC